MTATKKTSLEEARTAASVQWPKIYIGPSLPRANLMQYTVFADGYPAYLDALLRAHPKLKEFMVPTSQTQQARREILKSGTRLNALAKDLAAEFKGD